MNQKVLKLFKNIAYAVGANVSRIVTTLILTLVLPRLMSVEDYSYWQLYLFYGTYLIYSSVGWCEGTYLKYGGCKYNEVDGRRLASQFINMSVYEAFIALSVATAACFLLRDPARIVAMVCAACYMWLYILRTQIQTVLQAVNRISDYAKVYSGERIVYFVVVIFSLMLGYRSFYVAIFAELISNLLVLCYGIYLCREVTLRNPLPISVSIMETRELIGIGYKLTMAGLTNQLIIGIVRLAIERKWGTVAFGKISLSFSMANMMITCVSAVSIVLFPMLKKCDESQIGHYYSMLRSVLTIPMFGILLIYEPMRLILTWWLPQYADSLKYLAILFPLCIYEVRNSVLVWTYLKVMRRETDIMRASLVMIGVSVVMTFFLVAVCGSLDLTVGSIVVIYGLKAVYTEWLLGKRMPIFPGKDWVVETALSMIFIMSSWWLEATYAFVAYGCAYSLYIFLKRKAIMLNWNGMKQLLEMERKPDATKIKN